MGKKALTVRDLVQLLVQIEPGLPVKMQGPTHEPWSEPADVVIEDSTAAGRVALIRNARLVDVP